MASFCSNDVFFCLPVRSFASASCTCKLICIRHFNCQHSWDKTCLHFHSACIKMHVHTGAATVISHLLADSSENYAARLEEALLPLLFFIFEDDSKPPLALMPFPAGQGLKVKGDQHRDSPVTLNLYSCFPLCTFMFMQAESVRLRESWCPSQWDMGETKEEVVHSRGDAATYSAGKDWNSDSCDFMIEISWHHSHFTKDSIKWLQL